jgi:hypothetical protein
MIELIVHHYSKENKLEFPLKKIMEIKKIFLDFLEENKLVKEQEKKRIKMIEIEDSQENEELEDSQENDQENASLISPKQTKHFLKENNWKVQENHRANLENRANEGGSPGKFLSEPRLEDM